MALPRNYKRGIDYLNASFPFFTVMVTSLGRPVVNNQIPTLQVQKNYHDDKFELAISEKFLADKTDAEIGGCLAHEAFHIVKSHLSELGYEEFKDKNIHKKVVLAHECIVNDNVVNEGFDLPDLAVTMPDGTKKGGLYFGPDVVGRSVAYYSTQEVVDLIKDDNQQLQEMPDEDEHFIILSDDEMKELQDIMEKNIRHAVFEGRIDPSSINSDELKTILKVKQRGKKAGTGGSKTQRDFTRKGLSVEWFKYLRKVDPSCFHDGGTMGDLKTSWQKPRRKTAGMPGVLLPIYAPRYTKNNIGSLKPHLVLALDFSGSIPPEMTEVMGNLAKAVPDSIEVHCCTFSDFFVPFNHKATDPQDTASGGTNFSAIQEYIDTLTLKKQPSVVVITDGEARFDRRMPEQHILDKKWNWLMISRSDTVHDDRVKKTNIEFLEDYLLHK